jgi:hypothetical protein
MSSSIPRPASRTLMFATIVIAVAAGCQARSDAAAPRAGADPAAPVTNGSTVTALIADARAARDRHDTRTLHAVRARLAAQVGEAAVRRAEAAVSRAIANRAAAEAAHDAMARARSLAALRALCDTTSLTAAVGPCPASGTE